MRVDVVVGLRPTEEQLARLLGAEEESAALATPAPSAPQALGLSMQSLSPPLLRRYSLPAGSAGVVITGVAPNSAAAEESLREGDLISYRQCASIVARSGGRSHQCGTPRRCPSDRASRQARHCSRRLCHTGPAAPAVMI
jgi:hypothetical protein